MRGLSGNWQTYRDGALSLPLLQHEEDYDPSIRIPTAIGMVLTNLHALEFSLRLFLYESVGPQYTTFNLDQLAVGDRVPENPITNYDSLGDLVCKVNERLEALGVPERVDRSLVDLRDVLAHGRIYGIQPIGPFKLLKFSRAKQGKVQVTTAIDLTQQWLTKQTKRTSFEVQKVMRVGRSLGLSCFPAQ